MALLKDKTPKKPKSSKNPLHTLAAPPSVAGKGAKDKDKDNDKDKDKHRDKDKDKDRGNGTKDFPVTIPSRSSSDVELEDISPEAMMRDEQTEGQDAKAGEKRKRYVTIVEGGKKRKMVDLVRSLPLPLCPPSYVSSRLRLTRAYRPKSRFSKPPLPMVSSISHCWLNTALT